MKRKKLSNPPSEKPKRKRLREEVPDRAAPTLMKVGPKNTFKPWDLRKLTGLGIDKVFENAYLAVFTGPGYIDMERCSTRQSAQSVVSMFQLRYPRMRVEWLTGESNVATDNETRRTKANGSERPRKRLHDVERLSPAKSKSKRRRLKS